MASAAPRPIGVRPEPPWQGRGSFHYDGDMSLRPAETRIAGADFVRVAACLLVVATHICSRLNISAARRLLPGLLMQAFQIGQIGFFGVAIFFVLSGYLLARPFWRALDAGAAMPSPAVFFLRRAARILPAFWLALAVTAILEATLFAVPIDRLFLTRLLAGALLVGDWHWATLFPVDMDTPLWSIGFEATCYLLLPAAFAVIFAAGARRPLRARLLWVAVILLAVAIHWLIRNYIPMDPSGIGWQYGLIGGAKTWVPRFNPAAFFVIFAVGALAAGIEVRIAGRRSWWFDLAAVVGFLLAVVGVPLFSSTDQITALLDLPYGFPLFPLGIAVFLAAAPSTRLVRRLTDNRVIAFLASISFGVYLWHFLVLQIIQRLWLPGFASSYSGSEWLAGVATMAVVTLAISTASFFWLERPVIRWARRLEAPAIARVGAAASA